MNSEIICLFYLHGDQVDCGGSQFKLVERSETSVDSCVWNRQGVPCFTIRAENMHSVLDQEVNMHGSAPTVDAAGHEAHRQPIHGPRPLKHLNVIAAPASMIGKVNVMAVPATLPRKFDDRPPEIGYLPDMFNRHLTVHKG